MPRADLHHDVGIRTVLSPLGPVGLRASSSGVTEVRLGWTRPVADDDGPAGPILDQLHRFVEAFFAGEDAIPSVVLAPGGTAFQRVVWDELRQIPAGQTRSYAQIARAIGRPSAVRAVARANATNPLPILIPCHRVIGSDGSLTGYGGGLEAKRWLLEHERRWWGSGLLT